MSRLRKIFNKFFVGLFLLACLLVSNTSFAADGEALFKANCANCHKPLEDATGPMLKGSRDREPSKDWVYKWVYNTNTMVVSDPYAAA